MENKDWREEFDNKFPCIETECDNNGTMVGYDRDENAEQQQCQYCFEQRLPTISFIESLLKSKQEEIEGAIDNKKVSENLRDMICKSRSEHNQALDDLKPIISNLLNL